MKPKKRPNGYWIKERVAIEALKYPTPSLFQKGSKGAYLAALRAGFLNEVCSHMTIKTYWTNEMLREAALKHNNRSSFKKNDPTAYQLAYERKILDNICSHMEYLLTYWSDKMLHEAALEHKTRTEFQKNNMRAYTLAHKRGLLDKICSHMEYVRIYWTNEMLCEEALKYETRVEFQNNSESAYQLALVRGILNDICSHMKHSSRFSLPEQEIFNFVKQYYPDVIRNSKKIISPLELDIFAPSLNLAIEYCGLYWHSETSKNKNYHLDKQKECNKKGIRLITIFEDEWLQRKEQVRGYLKSILNKNEIKIFARKTDLKEVPNKEAKLFLDTHHIQGSARFEIAFGLYSENELVAVVTGSPHHRQGHGQIFVLNRLAFKSNVSIAGGSSRLLKSLLYYAKKKGFRKLLSWSDNRFSEGRVYESIGFTLENKYGPDYSYFKGQKRISKQSCQKKALLKKGAIGTMANTEKELAATLGLDRIWDCGKKAWSIDLTK
jgi:hypothetical protein